MSKATDPVTPRTRLQVLDPFIAELHDALGEPARPGPDGETICLRVSGRELTVDPWTSERLDPRPPRADPLLADCCRVVTQSVALLAKCATDLETLEGQCGGGTSGLYGVRAELMLDAAIGGSLVRDVQAIIDELLKRGRVEEAGHLSKFHHQLRHTVYDLRKQVAPEYRSTVETLAEQLSDTVLEAEVEEAVAEAVEKPKPVEAGPVVKPVLPPEPRPIRHRPLPGAPDSPDPRRPPQPVTPVELLELVKPESNPRGPSRTAILAVALIVAALCLIAVRQAGTTPRQRPAATEAVEPTFESLILRVEDRSPDLYITADAKAWNRLDEAKQIEFLRELATGRGTAHYSELFVQSADGRILTRWTVPEVETPRESRAEKSRREATRPRTPQEN